MYYFGDNIIRYASWI